MEKKHSRMGHTLSEMKGCLECAVPRHSIYLVGAGILSLFLLHSLTHH